MADAFDSLGIRARYVNEGSTHPDYNDADIVYASVSSLSLLRQRLLLEKTFEPGDQPISLVMDEADAILLDSATSIYILSQGAMDGSDPNLNKDAWIYPLVNEFVDALAKNNPANEIFKYFPEKLNLPFSINQEVSALLKYLQYKAERGSQQQRLAEKDFKEQLNLWIDSAWIAKDLEEGKDFMVIQQDETINNEPKKISRAIILENKRPFAQARWGHGVHQLLHARLNQQRSEKKEEPNYIIEPERSPILTENSRQFVEFYDQKKGKVLANTGSTGSTAEKVEVAEKYGFKYIAYPTHAERKRDIDADLFVKDLDALAKKLVNDTKKLKGQPILIQVDDIEMAEQLDQKMRTYLNSLFFKKNYTANHIQSLTAKNIKDISTIEENGGKDGYITISTLSDRGSNIRPTADIGKKYGLCAYSINLTTTRVEEQRCGRVSRQNDPGRFRRIFMTDLFQGRFGINLNKIDKSQRKYVIDKQQKMLDLQQEEQRVLSERKQRIQNVVMGPFQNLYETCTDDKKLKKLNEVRIALLKELDSLWQDDYHSDFLFEEELDIKNKTIAFRQRLNKQTDRYIERVNSAWQRCRCDKLKSILGEDNIGPEFDVRDQLKDERKMMKNKNKVVYDPNTTAKDFALEKFKSLVHVSSLAKLNQFKKYTLQLMCLPGLQQEWRKIRAYNEANQKEHLGKIFMLTKNVYDEYNKQFMVAKDRKKTFGSLFNDEKNNFNDSVQNLPNLLVQINSIMVSTTETDLSHEKSIFHKRKFSSRLRDRLSNIKLIAFSMLDKESVKQVLLQELSHYNKLIQKELTRKNSPEVKKELETLQQILNKPANDFKDQKICLQKAVSQIFTLFKCKKFNLKNSTINNLPNDLRFLYHLVQRPGKALHKQATMQHILSAHIARLPWPETPKKFFFIDNTPKMTEQNLLFKNIFSNSNIYQSKQEQFVVYEILNNIRKKVAALGGFDTRMTQEKKTDPIKIEFKVLHEQKLFPVKFSFDFDLNLKEKKMNIQPSNQNAYRYESKSL